MKKLLLAVTALLTLNSAFAQRHVNLQVTLVNPTAAVTMHFGDTVFISSKYKNLGPDSLKTGDTLKMWNNLTTTVHGFVLTGPIRVNDTFSSSYGVVFPASGTSGKLNVCSYVSAVNGSSIVDGDTTNNADCDSVLLTVKPSAINSISKSGNISRLTIFPNPVNDMASFTFNANTTDELSVKVSDLTGRTIISKNLGKAKVGENTYSLDLDALKRGLYFVELRQNETKLSGRINKL
jgi:hypothetical protein